MSNIFHKINTKDISRGFLQNQNNLEENTCTEVAETYGSDIKDGGGGYITYVQSLYVGW